MTITVRLTGRIADALEREALNQGIEVRDVIVALWETHEESAEILSLQSLMTLTDDVERRIIKLRALAGLPTTKVGRPPTVETYMLEGAASMWLQVKKERPRTQATLERELAEWSQNEGIEERSPGTIRIVAREALRKFERGRAAED